MSVSVDAVSRTMRQLLQDWDRPLVCWDRATNGLHAVSTAAASAPDGFLPALVIAGQAVWHEATGQGFALDVVRDPDALLGYRLRGIEAGSFTSVMLAAMEAAHQVTGPEAIVLSELAGVWSAASERVARDVVLAPRVGAGISP